MVGIENTSERSVLFQMIIMIYSTYQGDPAYNQILKFAEGNKIIKTLGSKALDNSF